MAIKWTFHNKLKWNENLKDIFTFYMIETPVKNVSWRGQTFKELGWDKRKLTPFLKKEISFLADRWEMCTIKEMDMKCKEFNQYDKVSFKETAIHIANKESKIDSFFYTIRCALAHGSFSVRKNGNECYYILENRDKGKVKGRIVIKENTLLYIKKIVLNAKKYMK